MSRADKKTMIDPCHKSLSVIRQCRLIGLQRSSYYYRASNDNTGDLGLMAEIDQLYMQFPYYGSRKMTAALGRAGFVVNRKRVRRLMRQMGLQFVGPKPNTSKANPENKVYPYLLRNLEINCPNQVWATDITYIPMPRGFFYLVAIMDWFSRRVLSWRLSNTLDTGFCIEALEEAMAHYGKPEIFNSDQGSQFTSTAFTGVLTAAGVRISMDGRGRCIDNVFVERLWRSLKYEDVYLKAYTTGPEARTGIGQWINTYNSTRPHQALGYKTPDEIFFPQGGSPGLAPESLPVAA